MIDIPKIKCTLMYAVFSQYRRLARQRIKTPLGALLYIV